MMITESDLREFLERDAGDGASGGVTVAQVDGRVRGIRRRRLRLLGGAVAAGLAVTAMLTLPRSGGGGAPDDVWTGVMAQPSPRYGARGVYVGILDRRYSWMGERVAVGIPEYQGSENAWGNLACPRGTVALYWLDGAYQNALLCKDGFVSMTVPKGTGRLEFAVVSSGSVRRLGRPLVNEEDARQVLGFADGRRAEIRLTLTDPRVEPCDSGPDCRFADESIPPLSPAPTWTLFPEYPETGSGGG
ncbi:hypothetical protein AB0395_12675 [Streptosporangium sp. NPDC051023]|uniref:hypothetical protein n=1 Tax=Streptosporangium sp. NPDC051023 TaxID=3155410 RepID=UPI00344F0690